MRSYTAIIERCPDTGLYVGYVPGLPGAHSQGETIDELNANLAEVIEMLLKDGEPAMESGFIGTQTATAQRPFSLGTRHLPDPAPADCSRYPIDCRRNRGCVTP